MWDERFAKHAPIVALSVGIAATWAILRDYRSSSRSQPKRTHLRRLLSALTQAVYASLGAAVSAGLMEPIATWPWVVAAAGATCGVTVDVVSANGPSRLADLSLRYLSRVRRIMREP